MASIQARKSPRGTVYRVLYRLHGKQTSTTRDTLKEARAVKALIDAKGAEDALRILAAEEQGAGMTVRALASEWLAWKTPRVTERTAKDYTRDLDNWVLPWFGDRAAELVTEADVQKWVDHMAASLEPKTVGDRHMLLHSMYAFGRAKSRRLVTHNPCEETELPKKARKPPKGTTVREFESIRAAAWARNRDAHDLILFLGETGWRFSEATALDVRDVADDGADVWVTVTQVFRIDGHGRQVIAPDAAKSHAGFRRIRLFPDSAAMVRRRLLAKSPGDLVFTNSRGRHWNQHTFLRDTWPKIVADANLGARKPTPHWLRHMHVAVCLAAGASLQEVQRRIGHENIATTIGTYGGMVGDLNDTALDNAAEIMAGKRFAHGVAPVARAEVVAELEG